MGATRALTGCLATGRTATMLASPNVSTTTAPMNWPAGTGTLVVNGSNLLGGGVVFFSQGFDKTQFNGIPLPALIPTSTGAPSGSCNLYVNPVVNTFAVAAAGGTAVLNQAFGVNPTMHGIVVYGQILGLDPAANPLGIVSSNMFAHQLCAPYAVPLPVARIFLSGSLGAAGTASTGGHMITRFY